MKQICVLLTMMTLFMSMISCIEPTSGYRSERERRGVYHYWINVNFSDKDGKDLIEPLAEERYVGNEPVNPWLIEINPDKYKLEICLSDSHVPVQNENAVFHIEYDDRSKRNYLQHDIGYFKWDYVDGNRDNLASNPRQKYITYKMIFPELFGNNEEHELVVYWDYDRTIMEYEPIPCSEVYFDGEKCNSNQMKYEEGIIASSENYIDIIIDTSRSK